MSEFVELAKIPKQSEADELKATTVIKQTISYTIQQCKTHIAGHKSAICRNHTQA